MSTSKAKLWAWLLRARGSSQRLASFHRGRPHRRYLLSRTPTEAKRARGAMAASKQRWGPAQVACCPPQTEPGAAERGRGRAPGGRFLHSSQKRSRRGERAGCIPAGDAGGG